MAPAATIAPPGASVIESTWRVPLGLAPDNPGDPGTEWRGPCPKCKARGKFTAAPGIKLPVVCCIHCDCDPGDVHELLKRVVPGAPRPGRSVASRDRSTPVPPAADSVGELAALRLEVRRLVLNPDLSGKAKDLALLLAIGDSATVALDMLGVKDKGNRSRTQTQVRRALALSPARVVKSDNRRRSKVPKPRPAETVKSDNPATVNGATLTSGNTELTERATLVSVPEGTGHDTDTKTHSVDLRPCLHCGEPLDPALTQAGYVDHGEGDPASDAGMDAAVALLARELGAEIIPDTWAPAEEGPCRRCGARTHIYGYWSNPRCADCRNPVPEPRVSYS